MEPSPFASYPLTTTFTPPSQCSAQPTLDYGTIGTVKRTAFGRETYLWTDLETSCFPSGFDNISPPGFLLFVPSPISQAYSPGLCCPFGYTTVDSTKITSGTTFVHCCRSDFVHDVELDDCISSDTMWHSLLPSEGATGTLTTSMFATLMEYNVPLAWQSSDLTGIHSTLFDTASTGVGVPVPTETRALLSDPDHGTSPTTGAIVGIVVGAVVATITVLSAAILIFRRRRCREEGQRNRLNSVANFFAGGSKRSTQVEQPTHIHELDENDRRIEVEGKKRPAEADAMNVRTEPEGDLGGNELESPR